MYKTKAGNQLYSTTFAVPGSGKDLVIVRSDGMYWTCLVSTGELLTRASSLAHAEWQLTTLRRLGVSSTADSDTIRNATDIVRQHSGQRLKQLAHRYPGMAERCAPTILYAAVQAVLNAVATDSALTIQPGTELYAALCLAEAEWRGITMAEVVVEHSRRRARHAQKKG